MTSLPAEDEVRRVIIRGDGSFTVDAKGDWVSARHYDAALAEMAQFRIDLAQQAINASTIIEQQKEIKRLQALLKKCAEPVSDQLAQARANLGLYNGYPSRERRYRVEIDDLEKLKKAIGAPDVTARPGYGNHCIYHPGALFVLADGCPTCEKSQ